MSNTNNNPTGSNSSLNNTGSSVRISPRVGGSHMPSPIPNNKLPLPPRTSVAGFVSKLFRMVTDAPGNLIYWSPASGASFYVAQPDEFARVVLPQFFKHNNFSSFVRQLNMYGFHKVPQPQQGTLAATQKEMETPALWEFSHESFIRGHPDLLPMVRRRVKEDDETTLAGSALPEAAPVTLQSLQQNIVTMVQQQEAIRVDLESVQRDSRMLWNESAMSRERHHQQQQVIDRILKFLATVFANPNTMVIPNAPSRNEIENLAGGTSPITLRNKWDQRLIEANPEFQKSVQELINYSHNSGNQSSPAIVPLDPTHLRNRVADLNDTNVGITNDIAKLQDQLGKFFDSDPLRSRSISPQPAPFSPMSSTGSSTAARKRTAIEIDDDEALLDELLNSSASVPPPGTAHLSAKSSRSTTPENDPIMPAVPSTTPSDDFDIEKYFATNS